MGFCVPTGRTVLTPEEQEGIPDKLLDFSFTLGAVYMYEEVSGGKVEAWTPATQKGDVVEVNYKAIIDMLYAGLYNMDDPKGSLTKGQIAMMCPISALSPIAVMVSKVMNASSAIPSEDDIKNADPNLERP